MADDIEISRRAAAALDAIKQSAKRGDDGFGVTLFISHHLEELPATYWKQYTGTHRPSHEQVLELLELRRHWGKGGNDGIDVFDFTLPGSVTDYVMSVRFNDQGGIDDIDMES